MTKLNKRSIDASDDLSRWNHLFIDMISNIKRGEITIIDPNGKLINFSGDEKGEKVTVHINDWKFCEDIFLKGDIGLGESYIAGYWDCEDISKLIKLGVENYKELERVIKGSYLKILFYRFSNFNYFRFCIRAFSRN